QLFADDRVSSSFQGKFQSRQASESDVRRMPSGKSGNATAQANDRARTAQSSCDGARSKLHDLSQRQASFRRRRFFRLRSMSYQKHLALLMNRGNFRSAAQKLAGSQP